MVESITNCSVGHMEYVQWFRFPPFVTVTGTSVSLPKRMVDQADTEIDMSSNHKFINELRDTTSEFHLHDFSKEHHKTNTKPFILNVQISCGKVWLRGDRVSKPIKNTICRGQ